LKRPLSKITLHVKMLISPIIRRSNPLINSNFHKSLQRFNHTESAANTSPIADDDVIHRVDLRVGKIVHIEHHAEANHLFIEQGKIISMIANDRAI
jgi:tRNA-binding EMAP/Myf-like protein